MSETIRLKWKERYEEFLKNPAEVYKRKLRHSVMMIKRYRELIKKHEEKIERLKNLIELAEEGKLGKPKDLEKASRKYMRKIEEFLDMKEGRRDAEGK